MKFQVENWKTLWNEGRDLFYAHWQELGLNKDVITLDVDNERYIDMDKSGILHVLTARESGKLVGYYVAFVLPHGHYKNSGLMAFTDFYYIVNEFRVGGAGAKLFIEAERTLRERGVVKAYLSCKVHQDHSPLFEGLGWNKSDYAFTKMLQGA